MNNDQIVAELGGDPTTPVWDWFLHRGPHGRDFTWRQTRDTPPRYVGLKHLQEIIAEKSDEDSNFLREAKSVIKLALKANDAEILRRAIQVTAVIGGEDELEVITNLKSHSVPAVSSDARACEFHLRRHLKQNPS